MIDLTESLHAVQRRIARAAAVAGVNPDAVSLLAVSKGHPAAAVRGLAAAGQRSFGESVVQEALPKMRECEDLRLDWHFIGQLQSNKSRPVAERFSWVHSLDRPKLARRLHEQRPAQAPPLNVCLEVRLSPEAGKGGVAPEELTALAGVVAGLPRLKLRGLMCVPPPPMHPGDSAPWFARLRMLRDELNGQGFDLDTLSMGMSADLEDAVQQGATLVRVGTALFGERPADDGETP